MIRAIMTILLALTFSWGSTNAQAAENHPQNHGGFLPENNLWIPLGNMPMNDMSEALFHSILDQVYAIYEPIFRARGLTFELQRDWPNGTVNAYAQRMGNRAIIRMFGGLARHETVTPDAFALVACHEVGHHLGGVPRSGAWPSNEGQSDYFSTAKCLRRVWGFVDNVSVLNYIWNSYRFLISPIAIEACDMAHQHPRAKEICVRGTAAGLSLGYLFADLRRMPQPPALDTPDRSVVSRTDNSHPAPQCRVDTYFHGALCPIDYNIDFDDRNPDIGACTRAAGYAFGTRPLCWYAPR